MAEALRFIEESQSWIYFILLLVGLIYLRLSLIRAAELRKAVFGLERERSLSRLTQAAAMLALIFALAVAVFVVVNFVSPAFQASGYQGVGQTPDLQSTQQGSDLATPTLSTGSGMPIVGCPDPNVSFSWPEDGGTISGVVEVRGTANSTAFGFYQYHYMLMSPEASWNVIAAGNTVVIDDDLGNWDTTWLVAGEYFLRLVVTDTAGEAAPECVIQVRVVPSP
jgi:hypothetical protein